MIAGCRHGHHLDGELATVAIDDQRHGSPGLCAEVRIQVPRPHEGSTVGRDDPIVGLKTSLHRRAVRIDGLNLETFFSPCGSFQLGADRAVLVRRRLFRLLASLLGRLLTGLGRS